jgi:hypothetical protein
MDSTTAKISDIQIDNIVKITIPVDIYLQEAENLSLWISKDLTELSKIGFNQNHIDDLQKRIMALRKAQSRWVEDNKSMP